LQLSWLLPGKVKGVKNTMGLSLKEKWFNFMYMKNKEKLRGAAALGIRVKKDKSLDKFSGKVLFPDKLEEANKVISKLKWNI
jgi:hypothetical protein